MTTLISGGGSQVGIVLARLLTESDHKVLFGSRSGRVPQGYDVVPFDWLDSSTFNNPFNADNNIQFVYLLGPIGNVDPLPVMQPFLELAVVKGVKRFVYLSGAVAEERGSDSIQYGKVHAYFKSKGLDYVVLRPTWFSENLKRIFAQGIREQGLISTSTTSGKVPWVAVVDIAQAAFDAIVHRELLPSSEPYVLGPEAFSYAEIAEILTNVLGQKVAHKTITRNELVRRFNDIGMNKDYAELLADYERQTDEGFDEKLLTDPGTIVGKVGVREWINKNKDAFKVVSVL